MARKYAPARIAQEQLMQLTQVRARRLEEARDVHERLGKEALRRRTVERERVLELQEEPRALHEVRGHVTVAVRMLLLHTHALHSTTRWAARQM